MTVNFYGDLRFPVDETAQIDPLHPWRIAPAAVANEMIITRAVSTPCRLDDGN
jgi:hypothetical protein